MRSIGEILRDMGWPEQLRDLAARVQSNIPSHTDPETFHVEKDEIASKLRRMARDADDSSNPGRIR